MSHSLQEHQLFFLCDDNQDIIFFLFILKEGKLCQLLAGATLQYCNCI